jgi:PPOX class probable F420-dependent enzyme
VTPPPGLRPLAPPSHADLLDRPLEAVLTTAMPDGSLQSTVVWFDDDGDDLVINTMREFQKARNLVARPRATILVLEPRAGRWIEVRGSVGVDPSDAAAHLDRLATRYTGADRYFGQVVPAELAEVEHPTLFRIHPVAFVVGPATLPPPSARAPAVLPPPGGCPPAEAEIPPTHRDLLDRPLLAALSTRLRSGAQTQPAWYEPDGNDVLVNTTLERSKGRNLVRDPRATVLVVDPFNTSRWIEIRGDVDLETDGALEQLDRVTRRYTEHREYYGGVYPRAYRELETRVIARLHPRRINVDAIH